MALTLLNERTVMFANIPKDTRPFCLSLWTFPLPWDSCAAPTLHNKYLSRGLCIVELYLPRTSRTANISILRLSKQYPTTPGEYAPSTMRGILLISILDSTHKTHWELHVLRECLLHFVKIGERRAAGHIPSPDLYPHTVPNAGGNDNDNDNDNDNPAGPCLVFSCACPGVSGDAPMLAGRGFNRGPIHRSKLQERKDEHGRTYTCLPSDPLCRGYEFSEWGRKHTRLQPGFSGSDYVSATSS